VEIWRREQARVGADWSYVRWPGALRRSGRMPALVLEIGELVLHYAIDPSKMPGG
jgi:hypothetical protein